MADRDDLIRLLDDYVASPQRCDELADAILAAGWVPDTGALLMESRPLLAMRAERDAQEDVIAELRAIAAQRTAEADAMRNDLVTLRRTLGAENALAEDNERLRARGVALAATVDRVRALADRWEAWTDTDLADALQPPLHPRLAARDLRAALAAGPDTEEADRPVYLAYDSGSLWRVCRSRDAAETHLDDYMNRCWRGARVIEGWHLATAPEAAEPSWVRFYHADGMHEGAFAQQRIDERTPRAALAAGPDTTPPADQGGDRG